MAKPTADQINAVFGRAMRDDLRKHGPSVNADVIDLAEQKRRNALFVLDVLVKAYVPKNTNDWREGLDALAALENRS
jgi:hypothetical protein